MNKTITLEKNQTHQVEIIDISHMGSGVAKIDDFIVFVEQAIPGDIVQIKILKVKKTYAYAKLMEIITPSADRVEPLCPAFKDCGGCAIMHMDYKAQLNFKQSQFVKTLTKEGICATIQDDIEHLEEPYHFRNKVIFPVGQGKKPHEAVLGFYKRNSHEIVDYTACKIAQIDTKNILDTIKEQMAHHKIPAYNEKDHTGLVRNVFIRQGHVTREIMIGLVVNCNSYMLPDSFVNALAKDPNVKSIIINYNNKKTNVALGRISKTIYGKEFIEDSIDDVVYRISLNSFYQINSQLCETLYNDIVTLGKFDKTEKILDAYCGIGTITLFLAQHVKRATGIEIVPVAIDNAVTNSRINNIRNTEFFCGDAEALIQEVKKKDVVIVDPPRKGLEKSVIEAIINMEPKKIFYVSCDPKTLARDLKILEPHYSIEHMKTYDFFPHSLHIESLTYLVKK